MKTYTALIKQALDTYVSLTSQISSPTYEIIQVYDDEHHHYLVQKLGWKASHRLQHTVLHVALRQGKIWIEDDWTEEGIATYFLEHGVPREDIVLGFQPPMMRPYTEFAVG